MCSLANYEEKVFLPCHPGDTVYTVRRGIRSCVVRKHQVFDVSVSGNIYLKHGKPLKASEVCVTMEDVAKKLYQYMSN